MTVATFDSVAAFQNVLIRKPLAGVVLVAPHSTTALTDIYTSAGGLVLTGHTSLGKITSDGVSFGNSISQQKTLGFGDVYPSRIDIESQAVTLSWAALETNKAVIDAFYNVDQSSVSANANGTITFDLPALPVLRDMRALALFKDTNKDGTGDIYLGVYLLKTNIAQSGDQTYSFSDACLTYPLQASALVDDDAGTPVRLFWGGPGLASLLDDMGYSS